jgi:hypothetical protein
MYGMQQPGPYYVAPPQQGMNGCLKAFLIVAAVLVGLGILGSVLALVVFKDAVEDFNQRQVEARDDVTDVECGTDELGNMTAQVSVTNDTPGSSDYTITVAFETSDGDSQLATATAFVASLAPGQSTEVEANSFEDAPENFTCRAVDVFRISDDFREGDGG